MFPQPFCPPGCPPCPPFGRPQPFCPPYRGRGGCDLASDPRIAFRLADKFLAGGQGLDKKSALLGSFLFPQARQDFFTVGIGFKDFDNDSNGRFSTGRNSEADRYFRLQNLYAGDYQGYLLDQLLRD